MRRIISGCRRCGRASRERGAIAAIERLDQELGPRAVRVPPGVRLSHSVSDEYGHRNAGFGADSPAGLVLTKEIRKVLAGLQQMGLTYRGLYGEGSEVVGNFFQISNQTTLGRSEERTAGSSDSGGADCDRAGGGGASGIASRRGIYY